MPSAPRRNDLIHLGLDVHKDSISVAILHPTAEAVDVERIFHDEVSIRRLIARFPDPASLRACYEAGPTGYELHRLLTSLGVRCQVIAPSLIPEAHVERLGHRYRSRCRPGAEAGSRSETEELKPMWDRGAELSQCVLVRPRGEG